MPPRPRYPPTLPPPTPSGYTRLKGEGAADGQLAVRRTTLPGGLRVVTEFVPSVRSASVGVWVGVGSRDAAGQRIRISGRRAEL